VDARGVGIVVGIAIFFSAFVVAAKEGNGCDRFLLQL